MYNVSITFQILEDEESLPSAWKPSSRHLIFDVKMNLIRKARQVKDSHKAPDSD